MSGERTIERVGLSQLCIEAFKVCGDFLIIPEKMQMHIFFIPYP